MSELEERNDKEKEKLDLIRKKLDELKRFIKSKDAIV